MSKINLLDPLLSSRIAAGEVIERPQSILRELLDNAIDAGSDRIDISIEGGGIDMISVADNGQGIERDDLVLVGNRHATSKIHTNNDLYSIHTLGFRGEALYSISAVTRLTIATNSKETGERSTLVIDNGKREEIKSVGPDIGTVVTTENLFMDIPARRAFLKRAATEAQACKNLVISKALAFPQIRFTFTVDGALRLDWPKVDSYKERALYYYRSLGLDSSDFSQIETKSDEFSIIAVASSSNVKRSDRKEIRIYVNNRPVEDYSLVQAVTYGYGELLPGGSYPYTIVFIDDMPELVDFNIHPTKKEVKLRNGAEIHHALSKLLKDGVDRIIPEIKSPTQFYLDDSDRWENERKVKSFIPETKEKPVYKISNSSPDDKMIEERGRTYQEKDKAWLEKAKELQKIQQEQKQKEIARKEKEREKEEEQKQKDEKEIIYIGQAFKLFLICQVDDELYLIDQHAAHERILYDEIISQKSVQTLLVPIKIEVDQLTDEFLEKYSYVYTKLGIMISKVDKGVWELDAMPAVCRSIETQIIDFITTAKADEEELEAKLFAIIACKAAIKAGDDIDRWAAIELIKKVFALKTPACPHGRTFLIKLKESELRQMVGRTN